MENGKPKTLLKNTRSTDVPAAPEGEDKRLGMVARRLNYRDRLLILRVVGNFFRKKQGATNAEAERIRKMNEILDPESVENYFDALTLSMTAEMNAWKGTLDAQLNHKPGEPEPPKPGKRPKSSDLDLRGKESTFYLPPKIDSLIQDALKTAQWDPSEVEFSSELCKKYQIAVEE
jgi:hypothetical protein